MANHSSVLAWRIPGTGEPGGLPSLGLHRVGHDWSDLAAAAGTFILLGNTSSLFIPRTLLSSQTDPLYPLKYNSPLPPPSIPCQPPFYFLSLWIELLEIPHANRIIQHLFFCLWLISLSWPSAQLKIHMQLYSRPLYWWEGLLSSIEIETEFSLWWGNHHTDVSPSADSINCRLYSAIVCICWKKKPTWKWTHPVQTHLLKSHCI